MTTFQTIQQTLARELQLLNKRIADALDSPNALMNTVIRSYLEKKGKQIRPIMVLLSAKLLGEVNDKVISGAVAVELLHNASLIHDDVVDDTLTRRGASTINGTWDNHLAVLVGDYFLSNALLQSVEADDIKVVRSISNLGRLLSFGEVEDGIAVCCMRRGRSLWRRGRRRPSRHAARVRPSARSLLSDQR